MCMSIPSNISQNHILNAIKRINNEGVEGKRKERKWAVRYNNELYPCKLLISYANAFANPSMGELDPSPKVFTTYMAQRHLKRLNFEIINISG